MTTTKKSFSFRLSAQAQEHLDKIGEITGMNQTAIVEYSLAKMRTDLKGTKMDHSKVTKEFNRRAWLNGRFNALYVGQLDELNQLSDDTLEAMVNELEAASVEGMLNLETGTGLTNLQRIVDKALGSNI